jgi:hypothetical protein
MTAKQIYRPGPINPEIETRKERFASLNAYVTKRNGWLTSIPGAADVTMECLPGSMLPDELRRLGYDLREIEGGERILHSAIIERFTLTADGEFEPMTEGSTKPIAEVRTHAGICKVKVYGVSMCERPKETAPA